MIKKYIKLLNDFSNDHTLATNIKVEISEYTKSFKPRTKGIPAKYDDANFLASIIVGAETFIYYLERNGYDIKRRKSVGKKDENET